MNEIEKYADQWDESAKYFYDNKSYEWMTDKVNAFKCILEIGCGTGYSTLSLIEHGHNVIAIDKNKFCIEKAKQLIHKNRCDDKVKFLNGDIATDEFKSRLLKKYSFDTAVCWNVGTYWDKEMMEFYLPYLLKYGLTRYQIQSNPESSYAELILWGACDLASKAKVPIHIIERLGQDFGSNLRAYYESLGGEFHYSQVQYDMLKQKSLSGKGRILTTAGEVNCSDTVDVNLLSILFS